MQKIVINIREQNFYKCENFRKKVSCAGIKYFSSEYLVDVDFREQNKKTFHGNFHFWATRSWSTKTSRFGKTGLKLIMSREWKKNL